MSAWNGCTATIDVWFQPARVCTNARQLSALTRAVTRRCFGHLARALSRRARTPAGHDAAKRVVLLYQLTKPMTLALNVMARLVRICIRLRLLNVEITPNRHARA